MIRTHTSARAKLLAAALAATALAAPLAMPGAALAWPFSSKPPPAPPAPPPPPPPPLSMSSQVLDDAAAFRAYAKHAAAIPTVYGDGPSVERALAIGSAYSSDQLERGAIAYAALLALQDPTFVASVKTYTKDPTQRHDLAQRLASDPRYAEAFPGADRAAGLIIAAMGLEAGRIQDVSDAVKQTAYDVQHQAWSKGKIDDPAGRLARTKALASAIMSGDAGDADQLRQEENGGAEAVRALSAYAQPVAGPYAPIVERGLALAALSVLGEDTDQNAAAIEAIETVPAGAQCLRLAKLNLYQCLAVAVPWYEDIFCLGEHALSETAGCIAKGAGTPEQIHQAETMDAVAAAALPPANPAVQPGMLDIPSAPAHATAASTHHRRAAKKPH